MKDFELEQQFLLDEPNGLISLEKWQRTVNLAAKLFDAPASFLVQYTNQGFQATVCSQSPKNLTLPGKTVQPNADLFCRRVVESKSELYVKDAETCVEYQDTIEFKEGINSYLGMPVLWPSGAPFGTFCVMDSEKTDYNNDHLELARQLKEIIESDLALIDLYTQLQKLALTDPLTELNNRRGFLTLAEQRIKIANRLQSSMALLYIDIDKFKIINDNYSHKVGDELLIHIARSLTAAIRNSDIVGRFGGDEFVVLMMIDNDSSICSVRKKIEDHINSSQSNKLPEFSVTVGVSKLDHATNIKKALDLADKEMLANKNRS